MRILVVTRLFPLPSNVARGTFVADHVELLRDLGHEIKVLNVLPRILKMNEARRSTMEGVSEAPRSYTHGEIEVEVKRHWEFPEIPLLTAISTRRINFDWKPEVIICHTIWPAANTAERLAKKAQEKNITKIFFDRGIYKYHGRVKIFAETLRKNGMDF